MAVKFNPFTGQLQIDEKGSGGASYIDGEVATYNDLPLDGTAPLNTAWLVRTASGVWPVSRKQAGIYIRTATAGSSRDADYTYAGTMPDVFSDAVLTIYDEASTTRTGQFNLGSITAGQNRVLTWPDGNGTIARTSDIPSTFAASAITSGTLDTARLGSGTASSGTWLRGDSTWQALPASGTKTYAFWSASSGNQPPSSGFMTLDTRNGIAVLDADDATTESAIFVGVMPEAASLASGLIVRIHFMATTATSGNVRWSVSFERGNTDLDSDSFDTATAATTATSGTSGIPAVSAITCTAIDGITAGDPYRLRIQRLGADAADTMTGDAEIYAVELRSAA